MGYIVVQKVSTDLKKRMLMIAFIQIKAKICILIYIPFLIDVYLYQVARWP